MIKREVGYILDACITAAVQLKDFERVDQYFQRFSEKSTKYHLDLYLQIISKLAYHGQTDLLLKGCEPHIKRSNHPENISQGRRRISQPFTLLRLAQLTAVDQSIHKDGPRFVKIFKTYQIEPAPQIETALSYRTGTITNWDSVDAFQISWERGASKTLEPKESDNLIQLCCAFYP